MCVPGCQEAVLKKLSRRNFIKALGIGAVSATTSCSLAKTAEPARAARPRYSFDRVLDLSHTLDESFPTYGGSSGISFESLARVEKDGYSLKRWLLVEHSGTHIDAPIHFSADGIAVDMIATEDLVLPLAVVDIREKAASNPDAELSVEDIRAWEAKHGPLPQNACVAMNSGWEKKVAGKGFRNADDKGVMHFPGFHVDAIKFLIEERAVRGIAVDTLSLDPGNSKTFPVHSEWLSRNRWGLECLANLSQLPASGATIVVGSPKIGGATGGPSRVFALL